MKSFKSIRFFSKKAVCLLIISCFIFSCLIDYLISTGVSCLGGPYSSYSNRCSCIYLPICKL